jgi:hypothetical protein
VKLEPGLNSTAVKLENEESIGVKIEEMDA